MKEIIEITVAGILGVLWFDFRNLREHYMTKENHDEICVLKLKPMKEDIDEIKKDVKELLKRNGGPR